MEIIVPLDSDFSNLEKLIVPWKEYIIPRKEDMYHGKRASYSGNSLLYPGKGCPLLETGNRTVQRGQCSSVEVKDI